MSAVLSFFASRRGIVFAGIFIGTFAVLLQKLGNPANMGVCVACFETDIAGSLGLHRAALVQYMRPEIIGFVLGALLAAMGEMKNAETGEIVVLVDTDTSKENVCRAAKSQGWQTKKIEPEGAGFRITLAKG